MHTHKKKFYCYNSFLKNQIFSLFFPIVKMNANYAEIRRLGNLEADFQKVQLVHFFFLKFSQYCCETTIIQIQQRNVKIVFLDRNSKKSLSYGNCIGQTIFLAVN